jgi:hypothetical protein
MYWKIQVIFTTTALPLQIMPRMYLMVEFSGGISVFWSNIYKQSLKAAAVQSL